MRAAVSAPDPYRFSDVGIVGNRNTDARTRYDPRIVSGEATAVFLMCGQSNSPGCNFVDTLYTPTHPTKVQNVNAYDGGVYGCADPLLTSNGTAGSWGPRAADKLIDAGYRARVILAPCSYGGAPSSFYAGPNTPFYEPTLAMCKRLAAVGLSITGGIWHQGEAEAALGTTSAQYQANVNALISNLRSAGFNFPWLIGTCTYFSGAVNPTIQGAQAALLNSGSQIYAGANTDNLTGSTHRQADLTHLKGSASGIGADAAAALLSTAIQAVL